MFSKIIWHLLFSENIVKSTCSCLSSFVLLFLRLQWSIGLQEENLYSFFFFFFSLETHLWHMEVAWLGAESELQLPSTPQPQQCRMRATSSTYTKAHGNAWSFNPLSEARDQTHVLMDTSWAPNPLGHSGNFLYSVLSHFTLFLFLNMFYNVYNRSIWLYIIYR